MRIYLKLTLVCVALANSLLVASCSWLETIKKGTEPNSDNSSTFKIYQRYSSGLSLNIYKSDYSKNSYILDYLVGTLFKSDSTGKFKPYLAESITTSKDKLKWTFRIRKGLTCESGEKINARTYSENLLMSLRRYKKKGRVLEFEKLLGFTNISDETRNSISGITYKGQNLILKFKKAPEMLIERLADSFFGYICDNNFKPDNQTWKNERSIISSGLFKLEKTDLKGAEILLTRRESYPIRALNHIKNLLFITNKKTEIFDTNNSMILMRNDIVDQPSMTFVPGVPTFTANLSTTPNGFFFRNTIIRKTFFKHLYKVKSRIRINEKGTVNTHSFFPLQKFDYFKSTIDKQDFVPFKFKEKRTLKLYYEIKGQKIKLYIRAILNEIGKAMNFDVKTVHLKRTNQFDSQKKPPYDLRFSMVDMDALPYFSLLDMVFCSKLGVGYSDPSGEMCSFISKSRTNHQGPLNEKQQRRFHQIIFDDGTVMPLFHRYTSFYFSKNVNLNSISNSALKPRIDLIQFIK